MGDLDSPQWVILILHNGWFWFPTMGDFDSPQWVILILHNGWSWFSTMGDLHSPQWVILILHNGWSWFSTTGDLHSPQWVISILHNGCSASGMNCFNSRLGFLTEAGREEAMQLVEASSTLFGLNTQLSICLPLHRYITMPKWKRLFAAEDVLFKWGHFLIF